MPDGARGYMIQAMKEPKIIVSKAADPVADAAAETAPKAPADAARLSKPGAVSRPREIGGPSGPEPTRYGDWERNGRVSDF